MTKNLNKDMKVERKDDKFIVEVNVKDELTPEDVLNQIKTLGGGVEQVQAQLDEFEGKKSSQLADLEKQFKEYASILAAFKTVEVDAKVLAKINEKEKSRGSQNLVEEDEGVKEQ
jgi:predicted component of viral defense system (DUF524 family)